MSFYGVNNAPPPGPLIPSDAKYLSVLMNKIKVTKGTVTQETSTTTAVTVNYAAGVITTQSSTLAAVSEESFTLFCDSIAADSVVLASVQSYTGTGIPQVRVGSVAEGSCVITVENLDSVNALNSALVIGFTVV